VKALKNASQKKIVSKDFLNALSGQLSMEISDTFLMFLFLLEKPLIKSTKPSCDFIGVFGLQSHLIHTFPLGYWAINGS